MKLLINGGQRKVDLYENDFHCLSKSLRQIMIVQEQTFKINTMDEYFKLAGKT